MVARSTRPRYGGGTPEQEAAQPKSGQLTAASAAVWQPILGNLFRSAESSGRSILRHIVVLELANGRKIEVPDGAEVFFYPKTDHKENKKGRNLEHYSIYCPTQIVTFKQGRCKITPVSTPPVRATFRPSNHKA